MDSEPSDALTASPAPKPEEKTTWHDIVRSIVWEILAVFGWCYAVTKVFVFDVDTYILHRFAPFAMWVLDYKLLFILGAFSFFIILGKKNLVIQFVVYLLFYPLILLLWRIPRLIFKQKGWNFSFGFLSAVTTFFVSLEYNSVIAVVFLITTATILVSHSAICLWMATIGMLLVLLVGFCRRFVSIFRPSRAFILFEKIVGWMSKFRSNLCCVEAAMKGVPYESLTHAQAEQWKTKLQTSIILSRFLLFVARKLREYGRSRLTKIASVFISLLMIAQTVAVFTFVNFALWRIDPAMFKTSGKSVGLFDFFYYSFNRIVFCSMGEIIPESHFAKSVYVAEAACALFLVAIFVSLLFSTRAETQAEELSRSIECITSEGRAIEQMVLAEYQFKSVEDALVELKKLKVGMIDLIYKLSDNM